MQLDDGRNGKALSESHSHWSVPLLSINSASTEANAPWQRAALDLWVAGLAADLNADLRHECHSQSTDRVRFLLYSNILL